jgi:hypothetical protein
VIKSSNIYYGYLIITLCRDSDKTRGRRRYLHEAEELWVSSQKRSASLTHSQHSHRESFGTLSSVLAAKRTFLAAKICPADWDLLQRTNLPVRTLPPFKFGAGQGLLRVRASNHSMDSGEKSRYKHQMGSL